MKNESSKFEIRNSKLVQKFGKLRKVAVGIRGFTVMELLLYMGLLAIFLTVLSQIFVASLDVQLESESQSSVQQDGRYILARFSYDIARASSISEPASPGSSSTRLQFASDGTSYQYELLGSNLTLTDPSGSEQLNSTYSSVSNLQFIRRGNIGGKPTITFSFTLTSEIQREKGADTKSFSTTVGTR